jgi:hypothetical protein
MAQNPSGLPQADKPSSNRREKAKEQGLAEQNVTGASPPEIENESESGEEGTSGLAGNNVTSRAPK